MESDDKTKSSHTGLYERAVDHITEAVKPSLHKVTKDFVDKSVAEYARDNPRYARIIEFEVRHRGDGAGLTQDFAEPLLWTGIKAAAATSVAVLTHSLEKGKFKMIGYASALGLMLNNAVELCRLLPRYRSGLQGSLEMAKDRWQAIEETGIDPFSSQSKTREINHSGMDPERQEFLRNIGRKADIIPITILQRAERGSPDSPRQK